MIKPKWYTLLPMHLHPEDNKIIKLEKLRQKLEFSDDLFHLAIANSRWAFMKAQEAILENLKKNMPNVGDKELWRAVFVTRLGMKAGMQGVLDSLPQFTPPNAETIDEIMADINSFEELVDFMLSMEKYNLDDNDPIQMEIDSILF